MKIKHEKSPRLLKANQNRLNQNMAKWHHGGCGSSAVCVCRCYLSFPLICNHSHILSLQSWSSTAATETSSWLVPNHMLSFVKIPVITGCSDLFGVFFLNLKNAHMDSVFSVSRSQVFFKLTTQFRPHLLPGFIPQNPWQQRRRKQFKEVTEQK